MKKSQDPRLVLVVRAAYNLGRFDGREEEAAKVRREMSVARSAIHCLAEEIKSLDKEDAQGVFITIDLTTARAARRALRKTGLATNIGIAGIINRKLKALKE